MIIRNLRVPFNYAKFSSLKTIGLMIYRKVFFGLEEKNMKINRLEIKNPVVLAPMGSNKCIDGYVTEELIEQYVRRTEGGYAGLMILEHSYVHDNGKASAGMMGISDDRYLEGLKNLVDKIHESETPVFAQINHAGSSTTEEISGFKVKGPSAVVNPAARPDIEKKSMPEEMIAEDILKLQDAYTEATIRARKAGFDGVEIHSAHGYLLNQFFSPLTNKRDDEYGCSSVEDRCRFMLEVIRKARQAVGEDYPISVRLGGCDYMEGGSSIADAVKAASLIEEAGADMISLSGGMCKYILQGRNEAGYFKDMTMAVKEKVSIPVMIAGGVKDIKDVRTLLDEGAADLIGVGRAILADERWTEHNLKGEKF